MPPFTQQPDLDSPVVLGRLNDPHDSCPQGEGENARGQHPPGYQDLEPATGLFLLDRPLQRGNRFQHNPGVAWI